MKYLIIIEHSKTGFSAYSPDIDGCVATGKTRKQVERRMAGAIQFHIDGMKEDGCEAPPPRTRSAYVEVST